MTFSKILCLSPFSHAPTFSWYSEPLFLSILQHRCPGSPGRCPDFQLPFRICRWMKAAFRACKTVWQGGVQIRGRGESGLMSHFWAGENHTVEWFDEQIAFRNHTTILVHRCRISCNATNLVKDVQRVLQHLPSGSTLCRALPSRRRQKKSHAVLCGCVRSLVFPVLLMLLCFEGFKDLQTFTHEVF